VPGNAASSLLIISGFEFGSGFGGTGSNAFSIPIFPG